MLVKGEDTSAFTTFLQYPTAISKTLSFDLVEILAGEAKIKLITDPLIHGNQQGTIHGGLLCELADAAIGTAHSTIIEEQESFASVELKINFLRPIWNATLIAHAKPIQSGKTLTIYQCEIKNTENKNVAIIVSTVITLRGEKAKGR